MRTTRGRDTLIAARATGIGGSIASTAILAVFLAHSFRLASLLPEGGYLLACLLIAVGCHMTLRRVPGTRVRNGCRVDWTRVYSIEMDVWGRTFEHAGAPAAQVSPSARTCPRGHVTVREGSACHPCDYQRRVAAFVASVREHEERIARLNR